MKRYYLYSIVIHTIVLFYLFATNAFDTSESYSIDYREIDLTENDSNDVNGLLEELIKEQIKEKESRLKEVEEIINEQNLDLTKKQVETFSDLITSSELEKEEVDGLIDTYFENRPGGGGNGGLESLKENIGDYINDSENNDSKISGQQGSGRLSAEIGANHQGSEIRHNMQDHTVFSEENKDLTKRDIEKLKIEEAVLAIENPQLAFPALNHKPAKYAILPDPPFEVKDIVERTQVTEFNSRGIGLAPRMNKEFVPNGELDEWDLSQPMIPLNPINEKVDPDFNAKVYLAWDFDEIFLAAEINDPTSVINKGYEWWTSNSLEVWFDALNSKLHQRFDSGCFQFWFAPYEPYFGKALGQHKFFSRDVPLKVKLTETGYIVEAVFRTDEELRYVEGLLGRIIGFHYFVNSSAKASDGFEKRLFWITDKFLPGNIHTYTWQNPNSWGDVVLTGSSADIFLSDRTFEEEYKHFGINELNRLVIQDADRNLDPQTQQFVKAFTVSKYSNDIEELVFVEVDKNSSKFAAFVVSETLQAKQNDGVLQLQAGEPVEIVYHDKYTPDGFSNIVKKTIYAYYPVMVIK